VLRVLRTCSRAAADPALPSAPVHLARGSFNVKRDLLVSEETYQSRFTWHACLKDFEFHVPGAVGGVAPGVGTL